MSMEAAAQLELPILISRYAQRFRHQPAQELVRTRASLLDRLKNWSDDKSWQEFFDTYWNLIFSFARQAGLTESEAEDVVQETLISVARNIPTFHYDPAQGSFKTWLLNLTGWRIVDRLRKRDHELKTGWSSGGATIPVEDIPNATTTDLERSWDDEWHENILDVAIRRVKSKANAKEYQAFDLCVFKEWPVARVSSVLGVSAERVSRAKYRIKILLAQEVHRLQTEKW